MKEYVYNMIAMFTKLSRAELKEKTNMNDRQVRKFIEELQNDGHGIVNLDNYYKIGTHEEIRSYIARERHRANAILKKMRIYGKNTLMYSVFVIQYKWR